MTCLFCVFQSFCDYSSDYIEIIIFFSYNFGRIHYGVRCHGSNSIHVAKHPVISSEGNYL